MPVASQSNTDRSFLVEGRDARNIFRVIELEEGTPLSAAVGFLENLPIIFQLRKSLSLESETVNEPINVRFRGQLISIYPPRNRVISCSTFFHWGSKGIDEVVSQMHVDNFMDMISPGCEQVRTCIHFDPRILGNVGWSTTNIREIELDIHVYPEDKILEPKLEKLSFGKHEVRDFIKLIGGNDGCITADQVRKWRKFIMYAVRSMQARYDNPDVPEDDPLRRYYHSCWKELDAANSDEKLAFALSSLLSAIEWE